jgi:CheY-like chemotaxis protein
VLADSPDISPSVVLIVEDDPLLLMLAIEVVEEAGFIAVEAKNADEAVALLEAHSDIDLLFTDIDMPGSMDGLKLAHAVRDRWPSLVNDTRCVRTGSTSLGGFATEQPICRKTIPSSCDGAGVAFTGLFGMRMSAPI